MATSGTPIGGANQQALIKRTEHLGQAAVTGTTRKADGTAAEERHDQVTLGQHEENAAHVGLTGQQGLKEAKQEQPPEGSNLPARVERGTVQQPDAQVLDPKELGDQLMQLMSAAPKEYQEAFKAEGKSMASAGMPGAQAAGQAAINITTGRLVQLEESLTTDVPAGLRQNKEFGETLKANVQADRAEGRQTPLFDILRQTASKEADAQLAKDPNNAEMKAYRDKLTEYSLLDQVNRTGRDLLMSVGAVPAGEAGPIQINGGAVVPMGQQGVVPAGSQGIVPAGGNPAAGGMQLLGNAPQLLGGAPPAGGGLPPGGTPPGGTPPGGTPPPQGGASANNFVPGGGAPPGGGTPPGGGVPPGGGPPGGGGPIPGQGPGQPGGPQMSAADQARRMQQILQDQESARDIWMQIWAERQKHEAERWKIMKETMDYWMKTFQESTVNQAMTMQRVNEMWHQYFRS